MAGLRKNFFIYKALLTAIINKLCNERAQTGNDSNVYSVIFTFILHLKKKLKKNVTLLRPRTPIIFSLRLRGSRNSDRCYRLNAIFVIFALRFILIAPGITK